jgi:hypothetical protein
MNNETVFCFQKQCMSKILSTLVISLVSLAAPLQAEFAYVAGFSSNTILAYRIGANGALTPVAGSPSSRGAPPRRWR